MTSAIIWIVLAGFVQCTTTSDLSHTFLDPVLSLSWTQLLHGTQQADPPTTFPSWAAYTSAIHSKILDEFREQIAGGLRNLQQPRRYGTQPSPWPGLAAVLDPGSQLQVGDLFLIATGSVYGLLCVSLRENGVAACRLYHVDHAAGRPLNLAFLMTVAPSIRLLATLPGCATSSALRDTILTGTAPPAIASDSVLVADLTRQAIEVAASTAGVVLWEGRPGRVAFNRRTSYEHCC